MKKKKSTLSELVYERLKTMILSGEIHCGEKILEQQLVDAFEVSRTPVREAIRQLSNEGIIKIQPNCYAEVISFTHQSVRDLGVMRITMDCLSAQLAIQNGSNRDFNRLVSIANKCAEANPETDFLNRIKYDCDFHMMLVEISENDFLINAQRNLYLKAQLLVANRFQNNPLSDHLCNYKEHIAIINALIQRDVDAALSAICAHLCTFYEIDMERLSVPIFRADLLTTV